MTSCHKAARPLSRCLLQNQSSRVTVRALATTSSRQHEAVVEHQPKTMKFDPLTVTDRGDEAKLMRAGIMPIGSRRRRAAIKSSENLPFEQLPYQCFQEARKVLQVDREEKLRQIASERTKIARLSEQDPSAIKGGEKQKETRLDSMRRYLERLKILADINDPLIKKRFEDGEGDMNKPVYRYLAEEKWCAFQRRVIVQRLNQLSVVPDCLSHFEPTADVRMAFRRRKVHPGEFVDSRVSEIPMRLNLQVFDKGERLVTVVVVDSDVPNVENNAFTSRLHFLVSNVPIRPTETSLPLSQVNSETQLVHPWLPPFAQKGSPYHRLSVFILQQGPGQVMDINQLRENVKRDGFFLKAFLSKHKMKPIGFNIFRSIWDEGTAGVMERHGIAGADVEFKRMRIPALKPKQKARGWEARHASDKYKSLRR